MGDKWAIFDIYCTNEKGERFIVEMQKAEQSLNTYGDIQNSIDTAEEKGEIKVITKVALQMLKNGEPIDKIMKYTGLSKKEIENLQHN